MCLPRLRLPILLVTVSFFGVAGAQSPPAPNQTPSPPPAQALAQNQGSVTISLDDAIQMALQHNHNLLAARTTIQQNEAEEITANLRPNPVLIGDAQFLPVFQPSQFSSDYLDNTAQFDLGVGYLFERGKKRQHRLQAAKDLTTVTRSQVADNERSLGFSVASQFINVELAESTLELAMQDLKSFQNTVDIGEARYKAGDIGEGDLLKIKLQMLQFQTDVSAAQLAKVQGLSDLRQLLGYESIAPDYDVAGAFDYQPVKGNLEDFQAKALVSRPDLQAAQQGVTAANSQHELQKAIGKRDVTGQVNYTHISSLNTVSLFGQIQMPIFDRNQGEIARAGFAITQAQEQAKFTTGQVLTDVRDAFENLRTNDKVVGLYRSGYLDQAKQSRDISEYAYRHGAASLLDFLDAERSYRATQLGYRQALASYLLTIEQLRQAVGTRSLP
ncbi:cobalt-zinc-cadmium efflux system outer membrane protein [Edaphobacter aggregans]|uniref:Cobalt-zinc-cadmium efflux system outer membrane protein n=1 Tax=Edaphobacter aggregans TaxID=570835 RepID=A0A428MKG9_9BACT|nr:TolC family protein [Edaphobacter aggregans]RSL17309.1 cobalt-zinc-cadmium efflux system outer membrane protein [Edaphobacter aggregans]